MKDPRPMRTTGTQLEQLVFNSGRSERPDADTVRKAAQGLDFLPRTVLAAGLFVFVARNARRVSAAAYGLVPVAAVAVAVAAIHHRNVDSAPRGSLQGALESSSISTAVAPIPAPPVEEAPERTSRGVVTPALSVRHSAAGRSKENDLVVGVPSVRSGSALGEQADLLNRARASLEAGRTSAALAVIDDYDRRFQRGLLSEEALLLRIEAVAERGDRKAASDLARRFLATYPASVHRGSVVAFLVPHGQ